MIHNLRRLMSNEMFHAMHRETKTSWQGICYTQNPICKEDFLKIKSVLDVDSPAGLQCIYVDNLI